MMGALTAAGVRRRDSAFLLIAFMKLMAVLGILAGTLSLKPFLDRLAAFSSFEAWLRDPARALSRLSDVTGKR